LRVRDAAPPTAVLERGAWAVPTHPEVMELNIPAIHGVGGSRIYFVDRYKEFSIYDVDFVPIPDGRPASARRGRHAFLRRRAVHRQRPHRRLGSSSTGAVRHSPLMPDEQRFGILPKGKHAAQPRPPSSRFHAAADRARASDARRGQPTSACSASAWACPTCWPRCGELRKRGHGVRRITEASTPSAAARSPRPTWAA
jgi:hypothetical protein